jgi:type I restriction enzyme S subunit
MNNVSFSTLFDFQKKSKIKAGDGLPLNEGSYPFYTSSNILKKSINKFLFDGNSLIFGTGGSASVHYCNERFSVSTDCFVTQPKNNDELFLKYIYYFLSGNIHILENGFKGAGLKHISKGYISDVKIPLPPLDQQKKIAAILDAADAYRQKTKALIEKYDELLNSIVYQCLGDSLNKDLKNIKSGSNEFLEDGYSWYSLNEITEVIADIDHKMPKSVEKGKIFLSAKDLSDNGELDFSNPKFISEEDFKHLSRKVKPKKLDVIYSRIGAKLGKARLVKTDHDFIVSYSCCTIRPKQDIVAPLYLKYILDSKATLRQASHGTRGIGVPDLGMGEIRTFKIPVPEKSISKKIVNQLEIIETQKAQAQASLVQAEDLFNSLLQRAFKRELV